MQVTVIGAGLAGCEAAWQLAQRGIAVTLHEMKPEKATPAHHTADFAELCCSNSLRSDQIENAVGLLKEELRRLRGSRITMVLQNPMTCFDPLYRIGNQMAETFATHTSWNAQEIRSRCLEILDQMRIRNGEEVLEKYPHQLSGGMCQRASLARALVGKPKVLLLDEPLGALDAFTRMNMQDEILRIWKETGMTAIMVTHDVDEAVYLSDKVVVMTPRPGRITGTLDIKLARPRARSSEDFLHYRAEILRQLHYGGIIKEPNYYI